MRHLLALLCGLVLVFPLLGCAPPAGTLAGQQSRVIASTDRDAVLAAAASLLRREFGRVRINAEEGTVTSEPVEFRTHRESGTARDLYRGPSTMRRIAHFQVRPGAEDQSVARLRIDIERQDTARYQNMQYAAGLTSDTPSYTPIQREAATNERQNLVWTPVRRDRALERQLLDELSEQFAPPGPAEPAAAEPLPAPRPAAAP